MVEVTGVGGDPVKYLYEYTLACFFLFWEIRDLLLTPPEIKVNTKPDNIHTLPLPVFLDIVC